MKKKVYIWFNSWNKEGHDFSMSVIFEWKVYAIELERLFKIKHYSYINSEFWYPFEDILKIVKFYFGDIFSYEDCEFVVVNNKYLEIDWDVRYVECSKHHLFHAFSAFYPSDFNEAAVLTVDYYGSDGEWSEKVKNSQVMWYFDWNDYKQLHSFVYTDDFRNLWVGVVYTLFCQLVWLSEWVLMGLSSYWNYSRFKDIRLFDYDWDDVFLGREIIKRYWNDRLNLVEGLKEMYWVRESDYIDVKLNNNITDSIFADVAAHVQYEVENAMVYLADRLQKKTKSKNLCLAGGVSLNILANTRIFERTSFENIFVQPAANDAWLSLWAAYYWYHIIWNNTKRIPIKSVWLGNVYSDEEILKVLNEYSKYLKFEFSENIEKDWGVLLSKWNIIWWFQWWSEFWPRALWFRSILADSRSEEIRDRVNRIKQRELWRPLAPVVLEEFIGEYFKLGKKSSYMTFSSDVVEDKKYLISGVVHIDGTARYQSVNSDENKKYYDLIKEFCSLTRVPVLINTSFNVKWQPIVESPKDAVLSFLSTDLDYLVIWNYIVSKEKVFTEFSFNRDLSILNMVFKDNRLRNKYYRNWNVLRKFFFWENYKIDFMFKEDLDFYFELNISGFVYTVSLSLVRDERWYYFKYRDLWLEVIIGSDYKENFSKEMIELLDTISLKIEKNYLKIFDMFIFSVGK